MACEDDTAVARCFPNILEDMVLENINLSKDRKERPPFCSNKADRDFCNQSPIHAVNSVYFNHTLISYVHSLDLEVFNFSEKIT